MTTKTKNKSKSVAVDLDIKQALIDLHKSEPDFLPKLFFPPTGLLIDPGRGGAPSSPTPPVTPLAVENNAAAPDPTKVSTCCAESEAAGIIRMLDAAEQTWGAKTAAGVWVPIKFCPWCGRTLG